MRHLEVELFSFKQYLKGFLASSHAIPFPGYWIPTVTGRSAMVLILNYLTSIKKIDSNSLVFMPQWLCQSMLQMTRKHALPTLNRDASFNVALIYHQYGFPQNMDEIRDYCDRKKALIIEDCANLYEGHYKGQRLGTIGFASIFSLSKFFPSIWGGGLSTTDESLMTFAKLHQSEIDSRFATWGMFLSKYFADKYRFESSAAIQDLLDAFYGIGEFAQRPPDFCLGIISEAIRSGALEKRRQNYLSLLDEFKDTSYFEGLERDGVCPYIAPLFASIEIQKSIVSSLQAQGIATGIYNFDRKRNHFDPEFVPCVWIPIHQGLDDRTTEIIHNTLRAAQKK
jgi:hypothetical protein